MARSVNGAATLAGCGPFSLGDAEATARLLERAGFDGLRVGDVRGPVFYGHAIDDALETVRGFQGTIAALATLSGDETDRAVDASEKCSPRTTAPNTA